MSPGCVIRPLAVNIVGAAVGKGLGVAGGAGVGPLVGTGDGVG